ncbi:hypothetical protein ACFOW1_15190 [Parasediminibacterium paludis]|uniref:Outer membrane protein beta-barrel domain-containing protein n=1 Tax=Parasediminibacterium paludis TaxID=908966 RepID=A0ABV8Q277_9BACT
MKKYLILILVSFQFFQIANAQEFNLGGLFGKDKLFKLNGGLNTSFLYNYSSDPNNQRDPFTMVVGGNLNFFVAGINLPVSFSYSNATLSVVPPMNFNKFSINPNYKWATLHLGTNTAVFSPYSLNGFQYNGVGFDLVPGKFKFKFMTGRLLKGTGDYNLNPTATPFYNRKAIGVAAEYQLQQGITIGGSLFHAKDDSTTAYNIPFELAIKPKENFVATLNTTVTILQQLKVSAEIAKNFITQDLTSPLNPVIGKDVFSGFLGVNGTTARQLARNVKLGYTLGTVDMGLEYEKVDLGYQCLGAFYNQNGFENTLMRFSFPLFHNKLFLSPSFGIQNDLSDSVSSQTGSRFITSINATYNPTNKLSINGTFNNNKSITNFRNLDNIATSNNLIPYYLDSIRLVLLNLNLSVNANYILKATKEIRQSISASYSLQKGTKKAGDFFIDEEANQFHNGNITMTTLYPKTTFQWNMNFNYNLATQGSTTKTTAYGPGFTIGKKFLNKKLLTQIGSSYNTTYTNTTALRVNVVNLKANVGYNIKNRHDFKFSGIFQTKASNNGLTNTASNTTNGIITLTYNYNF